VVNLKRGDKACDDACDKLYAGLAKAGRDVLYDDRDERAGVKLADMELIGIPYQVVVGPRGVAAGTVEFKTRRGGAKQDMTFDAVLTGSQADPNGVFRVRRHGRRCAICARAARRASSR